MYCYLHWRDGHTKVERVVSWLGSGQLETWICLTPKFVLFLQLLMACEVEKDSECSDQAMDLRLYAEGRAPLEWLFRQGSRDQICVGDNLTAVWRLDLWEVRLGVGDQLGLLSPYGTWWGPQPEL
jgi:hypothetical protein